jgi:hypothetical protein
VTKILRNGVICLLLCVGLVAAGAWTAARAAEPIGHVVQQQGSVDVERAGMREPLSRGDPVFLGDRVSTDKDGRVKIGFLDDSLLTVGSDSEIVLDSYRFGRDGQRLHAALTLVIGIIRAAITGGMPGSVFNVKTSVAVASARSTEWLVEAGAEKAAVFVSEGRVQVVAKRGGSVLLSPGLGIDIDADRGVGRVKRWGAARVAEAMARTSLE